MDRFAGVCANHRDAKDLVGVGVGLGDHLARSWATASFPPVKSWQLSAAGSSRSRRASVGFLSMINYMGS
jgi:hypothetical protein